MYESDTATVFAELKTEVSDFKDRVLKTVNQHSDELKRLRQIGFRVSATAGDAPPAAGQPLLETSREFQQWSKGAIGKKSAITIQVPFEMKSATPITGAGGTVHYPGISGPQVPGLRLATLLPNVPLTLGAGVEYSRETSYTPGAAVVPEATLKPATSITFSNVLATMKTVATITKVSIQSLYDVPSLQLWLDIRLRQSVMLAAEDLFLNAPAPDGLIASAVPLDPAFAPAAPATGLDTIGAAIGQLQAQGYTPDGVVLSGADANHMRLLKSTMGEYLWATPDSALGVASVWSIPTIISPKMPAGKFLVGAFAESTLLFVRQLLTVEISFENEDDFIHNLACLRAEERCGLAIPVPAGLVTGSLTGTTATATAPVVRK